MNGTSRRLASFCAACLVAASGVAAADDGSAARKSTNGMAAQGGNAARSAITIEEDREPNETPPPAPSGEERRAIGDHIRDHTREINACYGKRVQERKAVQGKLIARFDIGPNGRVIGATADGIDDRELVTCVVQVVRSWTFARPRSSTKLRVAYPWVFPPIGQR